MLLEVRGGRLEKDLSKWGLGALWEDGGVRWLGTWWDEEL